MSLPDELRALRTSTALHEVKHVVPLRLGGGAAFATLDRICPSALSLQDTQLRPTVLLREDGTIFADAFVGRDDERYFLLCEGPSGDELEAWLTAHAAEGELTIERLDRTHRALSVHGPWAWDLLGACLGPDVIGMPYLTFLRGEGGTLCFRTGKTGEYGYELLAPHEQYEALKAGLLQQGAEWELREVGLEALDQCALENWFFNVRREGRAGYTPLELGLQWRLAPGKDFVGAPAIAQRRAKGLQSRLTCLRVDGPVKAGDVVRFGDREVGTVLNAGPSPFFEGFVAAAMLELSLAVPGISGFTVGSAKARSCSPPVINNRSLYVSPQRHTWADHASPEFPPLTLTTA